jgi:undecaprenyl-diphosphatase
VDRPFVHNKVNLLFPHVKDASLPSDHAVGTMSIALGLDKYNKTLSILLKTLSIIVGISRIYVGHHYPLDILIAYLIAFIITYLYNLKVRSIIENLYEVAEKKVLSFKYCKVINK